MSIWNIPFIRSNASIYIIFSLSGRLSSLTSSVHFLFSVACELWRHSRGSILPVWIWGWIRRRRARKKPSAGRRRCPHRQGQCSCRPHSNSTPGGSGLLPVCAASHAGLFLFGRSFDFQGAVHRWTISSVYFFDCLCHMSIKSEISLKSLYFHALGIVVK